MSSAGPEIDEAGEGDDGRPRPGTADVVAGVLFKLSQPCDGGENANGRPTGLWNRTMELRLRRMPSGADGHCGHWRRSGQSCNNITIDLQEPMTSANSKSAFPSPEHNHTACRDASMARARQAFDERGLRLTELRAMVFSEIASSHHAIGAYEIIDRLAQHGTRLAPISVYRAIDALLEAGVVHRLESRNAYFACHASHAGSRQHVILACVECGMVAEVAAEGVFDGIAKVARGCGFKTSSCLVEIAGRCAHCEVAIAGAEVAR